MNSIDAPHRSAVLRAPARPGLSIAILTLVTGIAAWCVVESLPAGEVEAAPLQAVQRVDAVAIDGNGLPLAQLRARMETRVGGSLDSAQLERDRAAVQDWLATRGYLSAHVAAPIVTFGPTGGACVVFDIDPGPLYHLRNVELVGAGWNHAGVVTIARGDEAVASRLDAARELAEDTLVRHGDKLRVELVVHRDVDDAALDVTLVTR